MKIHNSPFMYGRTECRTDSASVACACQSYALPSYEYVEDTLSSFVAVRDSSSLGAGLQGAQPCVINNVVAHSMYIIYILPCSFLGTFHALPLLLGTILSLMRGVQQHNINMFS